LANRDWLEEEGFVEPSDEDALRFVPVEKLEEERYGDHLSLIEDAGLPVERR
jgi:hypothetical protein